MKKIIRIFSLIFVLLFTVLLVSCADSNYLDLSNKTFNEIKEEKKIEGKELIGILLIKDQVNSFKDKNINDYPTGKIYAMYQESFVGNLPNGEYLLVYGDEKANNKYLYPTIKPKGLYFSGIYEEKAEAGKVEFNRINEVNNDEIVYVRFISYTDAALMSLICILIVFAILIVICLIVSLFKFKKQSKQEVVEEKVEKPALPRRRISIEEITDEDMKIAAIVASIDYHEQIKEDVRIVSIREIK